MSKRRKTLLEKLLIKTSVKQPTQPVFIYHTISRPDFYEGILQRVSHIEELLLITADRRIGSSLRIVYELFPLIETIAINLFPGRSSRHYLEKLGYSRREADILIRMFRNGHAHNGSTYRLQYDDGEVTWGLRSGGGSGRPSPYDAGYIDEKDSAYNIPAETVFEYLEMPDGSYYASLSADRLLAHVKHDIEQRAASDTEETIEYVIGQKVQGRRRKPTGIFNSRNQE